MDNSFRSPITRLRTLIESWIFQTTAPAPDSRERRNTAHCTMDRPVEIRCSGAESSAVVTIMDVSLTGAAVRLPDDITPDHELSELAQGDEIALSGLVDPVGLLGCRPGRGCFAPAVLPGGGGAAADPDRAACRQEP